MAAIRPNDIAVIGMAGRFPGAPTLEHFWHNLRNGIESITAFTEDELIAEGHAPQTVRDPSYVKARGVLEDAECFDAGFFNISPAAAEVMDPQQRVFIECAWTALEHAGYRADDAAGRLGIYAGSSLSSYLFNVLLGGSNDRPMALDLGVLIGNDKDHLATRAAYCLNLAGPAVTVQSACSTSLVAIHLAARSLVDGECDIALAGGVSIGLPQKAGYVSTRGGILSPDGHCRPFDANANGIVGGNGVGVVALKGLAEAVADGDVIHAVIKGSAINNDGKIKLGYSAPSEDGQRRVIEAALGAAEIEPQGISYIEAHGTATQLGDPLEAAALAKVFAGGPGCAIGSVKANIGHLDAAAGVAGFIKTVLCLRHRELVPTVNFTAPNPLLDLADSPLEINIRTRPWPADRGPRRAGVSAFGIGGTNAHVILEEAPEPQSRPRTTARLRLLPLSARGDETLRQSGSALADWLEARPELDIGDVARTLQRGRTAFDHRRAIVAESTATTVSILRETRGAAPHVAVAGRPVVFMFPGQGAALAGVGGTLYRAEPVFRQHVDLCAELLLDRTRHDVRDVIRGTMRRRDDGYEPGDTIVDQPALFVLEYALVQLLTHWGVTPAAMIGHSLGEYVAACVAKVLSLEDAIRLIDRRATLLQSMPKGAMTAAALDRATAERLIADQGERLSLAAVNGPRTIVIAGEPTALAEFERRLAALGVPARRLAARHAFHSDMMRAAREPFAAEIAATDIGAPLIPYVSTLTGGWVSESDLRDPALWTDQLCKPVLFDRGVETLTGLDKAIFVEVGPGDHLSRLLKRRSPTSPSVACLPTDTRSDNEHRDVLNALGALWSAGIDLRWSALDDDAQARRVPLPTYPFERRRFWKETRRPAATPNAQDERTTSSWCYAPAWGCAGAPLPAPSDAGARRCLLLRGGPQHPLLAGSLTRLGVETIEVTKADAFRRLGPRRYAVDFSGNGFARLIAALENEGATPDLLVWLAAASDPHDIDHVVGVVNLARTIGTRLTARNVRLRIVTTGAQAIGDEVVAYPAQALLAGLCRTISLEFHNIACGCVDTSGNDHEHERHPTALAAELAAAQVEPLVALRNGRRWFASCEAIPDATRTPAPVAAVRIRKGGVYLVTGGLGGIGSTLALHLARTASARIALLSRTADDQLPAHKAARLEALAGAGADSLVLAGDVANVADMRRARAAIEDRFGPVHGIIHAAGVPAAGMMMTLGRDALADVLRPKVQGTMALAEAFAGAPLDFVMLCSSISTILGAAGQAAYCAANAFLDTVPFTGLFGQAPVISINWDTWRDAGMAVETPLPAALEDARQRSLGLGIGNDEGAALFSQALALGYPRLAISTRDLAARLRAGDAASSTASAAPSLIPARSPSRESSEPVGAAAGIEALLCGIWAEALGVEAVQADDNVFAFGADSLVAIQVMERIRRRLGRDVSAAACYEAPTPRMLARLLDADAAGEIERSLAGSEQRGRNRGYRRPLPMRNHARAGE